MLCLCSFLFSMASCGEDDLEFTEQIKLGNIVATAYSDGTITIAGNIEANTKIKTFELQDMSGNQIVDLMNDQLKTRGEDGKVFSMILTSANVKVQEMNLVVKTKGGKDAKWKIGSTYKFDLGYGSKSAKGSYVSIVDGVSYTMGQISNPDIRKKVEFALNDEELIPASRCKLVTGENHTYTAESFAQSAIYQGTIITSTGCIATYNLIPDAYKIDGVIEGVVIRSDELITVKPASDVNLKSAILVPSL